MDNRTSNRNPGSDFLTRGLMIPAWLLLLVAAIAILAAVFRIAIPDFVWALIALLVLLIGFFSGPRPTTSKQLQGLEGHTITVSNFPPNLSPELEEMSTDDLDRVRKYPRDGVGEILTIAGNLVFYDENRNLVNSFPSPVKLTFDYTDEDEERARAHQKDLVNRDEIAENVNVEIIPVYLYSYPWDSDNPTTNIWKPFPMFSVDRARRTMTIEFRYWGDRPVSPGAQP